MKSPSGPMPARLKWACRVLGGILIGCSLFELPSASLALWRLAHTKEGILARSGMPLAESLVRLVGELLLLYLGIWLLRRSWKKNVPQPETATDHAAATPVAAVSAPQPVPHRPHAARKVNCNACIVLQSGADARRLWQFDSRKFALNRTHTSYPGEPLPDGLIKKDWRSLFNKKLNIAWLPPEDVFIRVAQFPRSSFEETRAMVEFQLEKLSPMPVAQIVWGMHVLPHAAENMQTVIVTIVARNVVEEFLGKLQEQGFLADRLEVPMLDQLQATPAREDGAWIYPEVRSGKNAALVAWWCGGVLQNVDLLAVPPGPNRAAGIRDQLMHMAWAGELEGWLKSPPQWRLAADSSTAGEWESVLREALEQRIDISKPLAAPELAALTARRAAQTESADGLLPAEFAARYRQQFVDRLWMRGLAATIGLYLAGLAVYFVAVNILNYRTTGVEQQVTSMKQSYTNSLQLTERYKVLKERQDLKYAALVCWQLVAQNMPESLTLNSMSFGDAASSSGRGQKLTLNGSAAQDHFNDILDFNSSLRKAKFNDVDFFNATGGEAPAPRVGPNNMYEWSFAVELVRSEKQ